MQILKLSANKDSFKTIDFKPNTLNIILGSKGKQKENNSKGETVNGVGKTLSIKLIDYCLGARNLAHEKIIKKLDDWEFSLDFKKEEKTYSLSREANSNIIKINNKSNSLKRQNELLESWFFKGAENYQYISFRNLICRYLRIPKKAYIEWQKYKVKEDDEKSLLMNSYLLGLKVDLIIQKINIKEQINKIEKSKSYISKDNTTKKYLTGGDLNINISNIEKDISNLEKQLSKFNISEGYNSVKKEIEEIKIAKNDLINTIYKYKNTIKSIDSNLEKKIGITSKKVEELYKEAKFLFPDTVKKELNEISLFHESLIETRQARLINDKKHFMKMIKDNESELKVLDNKMNKNMEFLKNKISTTEYEKLQSRLVKLKMTSQKVQQYDKLLQGYEEDTARLEAELATENINSINYIREIEDIRRQLSDKFKSYVDFIYEETKYSGISITNNDGRNKKRFNINVEIESDDAGGIDNVKIFCMDVMIWEMQNNSSIEFLYHDGCILSETDPRQCYQMLKLVSEICEKKKMQYIINMNYYVFDNIKRHAISEKDNDFADFLENSIRCRLYDTKTEDKLLGIQI